MSDDGKAGKKRGLLALPVIAAIVSVALYPSQATELFYLGLYNYDAGLPLAGLLFIWVFIALRRQEFIPLLNAKGWRPAVVAAGAIMVVAPYPPLLLSDPFVHTYAYAGVAIATSWVGVMVVLEPRTFRFLMPYLAAYEASVGTATYLQTIAGDPLAYSVASVGTAMTSLSGLGVRWTSVFFAFTTASGDHLSLVIAQECSGTTSVSLFLLLLGLMYLDRGGRRGQLFAFAVGGTLLFVLLNALRVYTMILGGIFVGTGAFWGLHDWAGYVYYAIGYSVIILLYTRIRNEGQGAQRLKASAGPLVPTNLEPESPGEHKVQ